ncbi:hypothetical protein BJ170DRAFT_702288 [Xylariales sp. AK1849]|nr:hypothetical protein BJ170DRAFT_702288 [Xylariales sp. AK1849]
MATSIASSNKDGEKARLYGFEVPPLSPGDYEIITEQIVSAPNEDSQVLRSMQPVHVKTTPPYALPASLVHSYYPPSMRLVSATTLPHIVLKGAMAWERSEVDYPKGAAPTPWLALLLFTKSELVAPTEVLSSAVRPSGTKALTLPLDLMNKDYTKFCHTKPFPTKEATTTDGSPATADFIFANSKAFGMYFDRQDSKPSEAQTKADLERYRFLSVMTDTGVDDGTGHANAKLSTLIGHRTRPYGLSDGDETVYAHLVSIEDLENRINWKAAQSSPSAVVALVSLFSWTFAWERNRADSKLDLFEHLGRPESTRSMSITIPKAAVDPLGPPPPPQPAMPWVKVRLEEGYTIVRHRDIAGEASMALYRGPLTPRPTRRPRIGPSVHGTDLQIIDVGAQVLDVSYSTAWELGRSLAGRDAKFSKAMASLRRQLCMHAVTNAKNGGTEQQVMHHADDVMESVLTRLDALFQKPVTSRIKGLPLNGKDDKTARWQVPKHTATSTAAAPGSMTHAKLRRHLESSARGWIVAEAVELCKKDADASRSANAELAVVFNWIVNSLMSLKLVPATYLFPDPAVLADESINCFLVDDVWVDALVDGAMSLANTMGGGDDPVREQIRFAFNEYLDHVDAGVVSIGGSGFILKSGVVESFPDLEITVTATDNDQKPLVCPYRVKNEDMIFCLVGRGPDKKLADYTVQFKLPPHQQRFSMDMVQRDQMTFTFELAPYLIQAEQQGIDLDKMDVLRKPVTWSRQGKVLEPKASSFAPLWSWDTGVLVPRLVADMTDAFIAQTTKKYPLDRVAPDSRSLHLATQLTDRDHSIVIPFIIRNKDQEYTTRQIFPKHVPPETDTRDPALLHYQKPSSIGTTNAATKSWFTKQAFSQDYPGESIPAESNTTQHLVFSIKVPDKETLPPNTEVLAIEVFIPLGEDPSDLLDHMAPLPTVRTLSPRQQWIAALTWRKRAVNGNGEEGQELVVHLKPRGGGGAVLMNGLDASFTLLRATVNGVMGHDVEIRVKETYGRTQTETDGTGVSGRETSTTVWDGWMLVKE